MGCEGGKQVCVAPPPPLAFPPLFRLLYISFFFFPFLPFPSSSFSPTLCSLPLPSISETRVANKFETAVTIWKALMGNETIYNFPPKKVSSGGSLQCRFCRAEQNHPKTSAGSLETRFFSLARQTEEGREGRGKRNTHTAPKTAEERR